MQFYTYKRSQSNFILLQCVTKYLQDLELTKISYWWCRFIEKCSCFLHIFLLRCHIYTFLLSDNKNKKTLISGYFMFGKSKIFILFAISRIREYQEKVYQPKTNCSKYCLVHLNMLLIILLSWILFLLNSNFTKKTTILLDYQSHRKHMIK